MFSEFYQWAGLKLRGSWFSFFFAISKLFSRSMPRFFHLVKLLPYHAKLVSDDIVQCRIHNGLMLTYLESSSSPEVADLRQYCKFYQVEQGDVILDVGAHIGSFTIRNSRKIGNGLVVSFEPNPKSHKLLKMNIIVNRFTNVIPLNVALADFEGIAELRISEDPANSSLIRSRGKNLRSQVSDPSSEYVKVRVRRIDDLCAEMGIKKVDFIKIHAEGSELEILKGARKTLSENHINLAITSSRFAHKPVLNELHEYLSANGFNLIISGINHPTLYCTK